jgi:AcrR family transcriptional regulator
MNSSPKFRKADDAYHHGDLRNALLLAARRLLDQGGQDGLSLRELARLAGVSANAPYRHFASRDEILAEVAAQGFVEMSARFDANRTPDPVDRLVSMCDVYTGYAMEQPAMYRVMFGAEKQALMQFEVLQTAAHACFGRLVAATIAAHGAGDPEDPATLQRATALWALVHGWSRLAIDGVTCFLPADAVAPASVPARVIIESWSP